MPCSFPSSCTHDVSAGDMPSFHPGGLPPEAPNPCHWGHLTLDIGDFAGDMPAGDMPCSSPPSGTDDMSAGNMPLVCHYASGRFALPVPFNRTGNMLAGNKCARSIVLSWQFSNRHSALPVPICSNRQCACHGNFFGTHMGDMPCQSPLVLTDDMPVGDMPCPSPLGRGT